MMAGGPGTDVRSLFKDGVWSPPCSSSSCVTLHHAVTALYLVFTDS